MASYDRLAHLMADHNDLLILRTFSSLNIKNLLYYQAELANLECELREIETEDRSYRSSPRQEYGASWKKLSAGSEEHSFASSASPVQNARDALQWQLFCRIRAVLREYNEALIQHTQVRTLLQKARPDHLVTLRKWLERPGYGSSFLRGKVESVWDAEKGFEDFASFINQQTTSVGLTSHLAKFLLHVRRSWTRGEKGSTHIYTIGEEAQERIANGIMTVVSSIFPVLPIVILFFIKRLLVRLVFILVFTTVFAATLVFGMRMEADKTLAITTA
ncbi:hypothetical protein LTS15_000212 [Exophiala xenobiotica]|nr:hypothetical protein LTS15_000212 [Exophiala xenobiotica]